MSRRAAAERCGVSASSVIRWDQLRREQDQARPRPQGGDQTSHRIQAHAAAIFEAVRRQPGITLKEMRQTLAVRGVSVTASTLWRFFDQHGTTLKSVWAAPSSLYSGYCS